MNKANDTQVGGAHYKFNIQHWDWVWSNDLDYFQGQITKYVARYKHKNGIEDLYKARHFLDKYIELIEADEVDMKVECNCAGIEDGWHSKECDKRIANEANMEQRGDSTFPTPAYVDQ